jgi:DNA-binding NarL/FixJ family response regulator
MVIVDDHAIVREMLRHMCADHLGLDVVGEAGTGTDAIAAIYRVQPDLVLLDLDLPDINGFDVFEGIRHMSSFPRVIVVSALTSDYVVHQCNKMPIKGFLDKPFSLASSLKEAIQVVMTGRTYFSAHFSRRKAELRSDPRSFDKILSDQEQIVLALTANHIPSAEIASRLGIALMTVETHLRNLSFKLGLHGRPALARYATGVGLALRMMPRTVLERRGGAATGF